MPTETKSEDATGLESDKPVPRPPKSNLRRDQINTQNRRREYLERNPSYLEIKDHELADPVLYERLVKRFQTAAERSAEVKAQGYGRTLEADLLRGENRLAELPGSTRSQTSTLSPDQDLEQDWSRPATGKSDGMDMWHMFLADRFVHGKDDEFDYSTVDTNDDYDSLARGDAEEAWFDDEEPSVLAEDEPETSKSPRQGDTGVQDF